MLFTLKLAINQLRHGLVVRIAGSHPGSIPGAGITFLFVVSCFAAKVGTKDLFFFFFACART